MANRINTVNDYLATLTPDQRAHLEKIRRVVLAVSSELEEGLNYSTPAYRANGKLVIGLASARTHTGFYVMSEAVMAQFKDKLKDYELAKTSFKVPFTKTVQEGLIKQVVLARMKENDGKLAASAAKKKTGVKRA